MGFKPRDVYAVTVPEFWACFDAWVDYNRGPAQPAPMTHAELDRLMLEYGLS